MFSQPDIVLPNVIVGIIPLTPAEKSMIVFDGDFDVDIVTAGDRKRYRNELVARYRDKTEQTFQAFDEQREKKWLIVFYLILD